MPAPIVSEPRVGIDVVFAVLVVSPREIELELVGSGNDKGEPTTQLGRRVPNDTDADTADEEMFTGEEVCGLKLLKFVVVGAPAELGKVEAMTEKPEVVKGSAALLFRSVVTNDGRRELDMLIGLLDTVSDDTIPLLEVEPVNDVRLVDNGVVVSLVPLAESLVPGGCGEGNVELVVIDAVGVALAGKSELALNDASGIVADCESVLSVWPPWSSSPPSPGVGADVVAVAEGD